MTWLGILNFVVLQWFGVRLARCEMLVKIPHGIPLAIGSRCAHYNRHGEMFRGRVASVEFGAYRLRQYRLLRWLWPLTGWWSDFRWIGRRW